MFAVITPALMTGAFADRLRFGPYLIFIAIWIIIVYAPFCHWIWSSDGWMGKWGVKDFAGGALRFAPPFSPRGVPYTLQQRGAHRREERGGTEEADVVEEGTHR